MAESGLRYPNMHTTALCSPTRACILTGRNHQVSVDLAGELIGDDEAAVRMLMARQ